MMSARYATTQLPLLPSREERAGERRRTAGADLPLSPLLRRGERESAAKRSGSDFADLNLEASALAAKIQENFEELGA